MSSSRFEIEGMSCGHCVRAVTEAVRAVPGAEVRDIAVGSAEVAFDPARTSAKAIAAAIEGAGYRARETGASAWQGG